MLSIGEFALMCDMPPETLRYYHAERLLVPDRVDERNGYRYYAFEQVEEAMLVSTLRRAGVAVRDVRAVLDDPSRALAVVADRAAEVARLRAAEDRALHEAQVLAAGRPEVFEHRFPSQTVLAAPVHHEPEEESDGGGTGEPSYDWERVQREFDGVVRRLRDVAAAHGLDGTGTAWMAPAIETPQQRAANLTAAGPHWLAKLPVGPVDAAPPAAGVEVQTWPARSEIGLRLPGAFTMAKYGTALSRLMRHPLDGRYPDVGAGQRLVVRDVSVEVLLQTRPLDDTDDR